VTQRGVGPSDERDPIEELRDGNPADVAIGNRLMALYDYVKSNDWPLEQYHRAPFDVDRPPGEGGRPWPEPRLVSVPRSRPGSRVRTRLRPGDHRSCPTCGFSDWEMRIPPTLSAGCSLSVVPMQLQNGLGRWRRTGRRPPAEDV